MLLHRHRLPTGRYLPSGIGLQTLTKLHRQNACISSTQRADTNSPISSLTTFDHWVIIPPSSSLGAFMSLRSSPVNVLILSGDPEIQDQYKDVFRDANITSAKDVSTLPKDAHKRTFDAIVVESTRQAPSGEILKQLHGIDPARTLIVTGSRPVLKRTSSLLQMPKPQSNGAGQALCLETFLEHKVEDFVKGMRNGSARNLHPMLISAVERPLITLALKETKGNQIQAAELLGLNRNTLRRKIQDLHIPVKRARTH